MQGKKPGGSSGGGRSGELQGDEAQRNKKKKKKVSCFSNIKIFLVSECALMLAQGTVGAYLVSVLTTLERRFNLQSADVGVIASSFEIGNLALILFVSYFGARGHRPRLIGCGGIVMALGALLSALPEFLTHQYKYEAGEIRWGAEGRDVCAANGSGSDEGPDPDLICRNRTATNMMYLLLIGAQVLLGIGATPVQPLGVSYIDDHVRRKDSSLYIGILFTMLVFGPACGFILGSFCTKIYVDAVFIDTSNLDITPDDPRWIGAWWGGFLLCGALLFFSSLLMFGFPQSLPPHSDPAMESEQAMLPEREYERPKPSNGVLRHPLEPDSSASCFQQLRGFWPVFDQSMDVDLARASGVLSATTGPHVTTCVGEDLLLAPWLLNGRGCASPGAKTDLPWGLWASCCQLPIFWQVLYILVREHIHPAPPLCFSQFSRSHRFAWPQDPAHASPQLMPGHRTHLMLLHLGRLHPLPSSCQFLLHFS
ncbi:solute carrier organic anion transporter family member 3A1 isoform X5 [Macaca fascicularis]|uniref:solute carrier organic anion transporter family member 3A1 isoform X5 n=1 Tax=Macaca fascicularis TaxID=9541 RepID=UPI003D159229